jgi:hypothetical protein
MPQVVQATRELGVRLQLPNVHSSQIRIWLLLGRVRYHRFACFGTTHSRLYLPRCLDFRSPRLCYHSITYVAFTEAVVHPTATIAVHSFRCCDRSDITHSASLVEEYLESPTTFTAEYCECITSLKLRCPVFRSVPSGNFYHLARTRTS